MEQARSLSMLQMDVNVCGWPQKYRYKIQSIVEGSEECGAPIAIFFLERDTKNTDRINCIASIFDQRKGTCG